MTLVNVTNVTVENPEAPFTSTIKLAVTFECLRDLIEPIDWKLVYIGSAHDETLDQTLEEFEMGPLSAGVMQFNIEAEPPKHGLIPRDELLRNPFSYLGVTAMILSASYRGNEFFRVGYYIYNRYNTQELCDHPPSEIQIDKVIRGILFDKPRITRIEIQWQDKETHSLSTN